MVSKAFKKTQPTWGRFSSMVCQWCVVSAVTMESLWIAQNEIRTGSLTGCCWLGQANLISISARILLDLPAQLSLSPSKQIMTRPLLMTVAQ